MKKILSKLSNAERYMPCIYGALGAVVYRLSGLLGVCILYGVMWIITYNRDPHMCTMLKTIGLQQLTGFGAISFIFGIIDNQPIRTILLKCPIK